METVVIAAGAPSTKCWRPWPPPDPRTSSATLGDRTARPHGTGRRLRLASGTVSTNSEPLLMEDRQAIVEAWDVPVHNLWGSTEIGVQVGCSVGEGLHICEDEVVLERVDANGAPVGPTNRRREHSPPDWPIARSRSSAMTSATM